jgi:predicted neuraminidase
MIPFHDHLFGDERPFASCHAATLASLPDGSLIAARFAGTAEGHPDTAIWGATRTTAGWSPPRLLAKVGDVPHWNPVLFPAPDGVLHLWWKAGPSPRDWATWTMISTDGGTRWSAPRELVPGDVGGRGPVKNKPIVLRDGSWLAPASRETTEYWQVFVDRSADGGQTWTPTPPLRSDPTVTGLGVIQPALWESAPGQVHMLTRSTCGRVCRSDSTDGGYTWSVVAPTELPNNNSGIDLARLADGRLVLACNPVAGNWAARTPLTLLLSGDNGATWRTWRELEIGDGEYSYPSIVPLPGGVAVVYTWRRERIACWMGPGPDEERHSS